MFPKLRVWDKTTNQMRGCYGFNELEREVYVCSVADDEFNGRLRTVHALKRDFDEVILMQSTGLKDKHGVEIYEGDVVEYLDGEFSFIAKVAWSDWMWYLEGINPKESFMLDDVADNETADVEIIGNIYENPELLEVAE